jgi:hypothetical protein
MLTACSGHGNSLGQCSDPINFFKNYFFFLSKDQATNSRDGMIFPTYENKIRRKRGKKKKKKKSGTAATLAGIRSRFGQSGTYDRVAE